MYKYCLFLLNQYQKGYRYGKQFSVFVNLRSNYTTNNDLCEIYNSDFIVPYNFRQSAHTNVLIHNFSNIRLFMKMENQSCSQTEDISNLSNEELNNKFIELLAKQNEYETKKLVLMCKVKKINISKCTFKELLRFYSKSGKIDMVKSIIEYIEMVNKDLFSRNGEFRHIIARAECMKGNSEKGLTILNECYEKNVSLRSLYRVVYRELIRDSVLNKSEASMVIFKRKILELSDSLGDHYPLICFWHICWMSKWFSDQMMSNDLFDSSSVLRSIVKDKATTFCMNALKMDYNEDAVVRLLQSLLKYKFMTEYAKTLQVLFSYKLTNRDIRGCSEIIKNCDVLGISLSPDQQGRYIKLLIDGKPTINTKIVSKNFKLKF